MRHNRTRNALVLDMDFQPNLLPSLDRIKQCRILVVGDVMLDRYLYGDVNRISPEAPVPVVNITREENRLEVLPMSHLM